MHDRAVQGYGQNRFLHGIAALELHLSDLQGAQPGGKSTNLGKSPASARIFLQSNPICLVVRLFSWVKYSSDRALATFDWCRNQIYGTRGIWADGFSVHWSWLTAMGRQRPVANRSPRGRLTDLGPKIFSEFGWRRFLSVFLSEKHDSC